PGAARQPAPSRLVQGVDDLAVDVELELLRRPVADAHGPRALVALEPGYRPLAEAAVAHHAVHDLQVGRIAGDGAQQPLAPGGGLVAVAAHEEGVEDTGRVAQPAVAVVPVARAADELGQ